ncbi:MAG: ABC transporter permease, partial [Gammaproteobacteria bacterium]|nr:ABC transporter permease [Gammaproteobacteria bacterium]
SRLVLTDAGAGNQTSIDGLNLSPGGFYWWKKGASGEVGSYAAMIDNATALLSGHLQVQAPGYQEDQHIEDTVTGSAALANSLRQQPGVRAVAERVVAFTLASAGERSFAGQLLGIDVEHERLVSNIPAVIVDGRYLRDTPDGAVVEAVAGAGLARNLGVRVGDEVILLGTDATGGVAALVTRLVGIFSTGQAELDRFLLEVPIAAVRDAFSIADEAHQIVVRAYDVRALPRVTGQVRAVVPKDVTVLTWQQLMPELQQAIELDRASGQFFYGILAIIVGFSIINTFIMLVFERTREFGMLLAVGMRPWAIIGMLQIEALWLGLLGIAGGLIVAVPCIVWVAQVGIPLGDDAGAMLAAFHMPDRFYTALHVDAIVPPAITMLLATLFASAVGSLRVLHVRPVEAMRAA